MRRVDANAEVDPVGPRHVTLALRDAALDGDRAFDRIDHARELAQRIVAGEVDDPAAMLADEGFQQLVTGAFSLASVPASSRPMRRE